MAISISCFVLVLIPSQKAISTLALSTIFKQKKPAQASRTTYIEYLFIFYHDRLQRYNKNMDIIDKRKNLHSINMLLESHARLLECDREEFKNFPELLEGLEQDSLQEIAKLSVKS